MTMASFRSGVSFLKMLPRHVLLVGVVCFIAGGVVGWIIAPHHDPSSDIGVIITNDEGEMNTATTTTQGSIDRSISVYESNDDSLRVAEQTAGNEVYVAAVALSHPGWVAVREEHNGEGGAILGAQWFPEGEHEGTVELLRGTTVGQRYHAYLFLDDGDKQFDAKKDTPVTRNGLLLLQPFIVH
jgi:hypothetical protein